MRTKESNVPTMEQLEALQQFLESKPLAKQIMEIEDSFDDMLKDYNPDEPKTLGYDEVENIICVIVMRASGRKEVNVKNTMEELGIITVGQIQRIRIAIASK